MVDQLVHVAAGQFFGSVSQRARRGLVDESQAAVQVDAVDAVSDRLEDQLALAREQVERLFCLVLLGYVHAVVEDERPFAGQLHAAAAESDAAVDAVAAAKRQSALPLVFGFKGAQAVLESCRAASIQKL